MIRWYKVICIVLWVLPVFATYSYAQTPDTVKVPDSGSQVSSSTEKKYSVSYGKSALAYERYIISNQKNISYKIIDFKNTEIFEKIINLESQECEALKNRDSLRLMTLWARDFTLDETQSLVSSKGGIPFYIGLYRIVEEVTPIDSVTVMCTGIESQRQIGTYHTDKGEKKKFFHIWTNFNGVWKLTTKRNDSY